MNSNSLHFFHPFHKIRCNTKENTVYSRFYVVISNLILSKLPYTRILLSIIPLLLHWYTLLWTKQLISNIPVFIFYGSWSSIIQVLWETRTQTSIRSAAPDEHSFLFNYKVILCLKSIYKYCGFLSSLKLYSVNPHYILHFNRKF